MKAFPRLLGISVLTTLLAGCCGYRVGPVSPTSYHTVAVPVFRNATYQPQLEGETTAAIVRAFQTDGTLRVTAASEADIILTGEIIRYNREDLRSLRNDTRKPREYRITVDAKLRARDRRTGALVLKDTIVRGRADTFIGTDQQSAEQQALPLCAEDLARKTVRMIVEAW